MLEIENSLKTFGPITLKEMDRSGLMDRTDTKFIFPYSDLAMILDEVKSNYKIVEIGSKRICSYQTLYYDTPGLSLYLNHHNGKLNRYKIRHRTYVESKLGFLEVKFKNNKGRTIKQRIKKTVAPEQWCDESAGFLAKKTPLDPGHLSPVLWVNYKRITLVHNANAERVTIDTDLEFISSGSTRQMHNLVIAEVKREKKTSSAFLNVMKHRNIKEGSISKYCMGIALTNSSVKKNNFKEKLISLKNIMYAGNHSTSNS